MGDLRKSVLNRGHSRCKGPEVGECLTCSRNGREVRGLEGVSVSTCPEMVCMKGKNKAGLGRQGGRDGEGE